jgi:hypothetical protein
VSDDRRCDGDHDRQDDEESQQEVADALVVVLFISFSV